MADTLEEYKRLFRVAIVADQMKLFQLHIDAYLVVNLLWVALNAMGSIKIYPVWAIFYSPVGWGLLVIVHYWFFIRGAENLCKLKEEMVAAKVA
jgi:hypothetical protein